MNKFKINPKVEIKSTFVDIVKESNMICIYDEKELVDTLPLTKELASIFERRGSFKGICAEKDNEWTVEIIRHASIHQHSENSFLDGILPISDIVEKTPYGSALTDHGNMHGVYEFYTKMTKAGKKPVLGCEVYVERICKETSMDKSLMDLEYKRKHFFGDHLILLAKDNKGLKNLNKLVSNSHETFHGKPTVTIADLRRYSEGIIATSACIGGSLGQYLIQKYNATSYADALLATDNEDALIAAVHKFELQESFIQTVKDKSMTKESLAEAIAVNAAKNANIFIKSMVKIFGREDFYIEIQRHQFELEDIIMDEILSIARQQNLKIVCGVDSHYKNKEDVAIHEIWLCLQIKKTMQDETRMQFDGTGYHILSNQEVTELFKDIPDALDNTLEILEKCNATMGRNGKYYLPKFPLNKEDLNSEEDFENQKEYFLKKVREGYRERFVGTKMFKDEEYLERIQFEIDTIINMGFPAYFTIVQDFILYAEDINVFEHWRNYFPPSTTEKYASLVSDDFSELTNETLKDLDRVASADVMQEVAAEVNDRDFSEFVNSITKTKRILVGPGRGSAAGSLVAYCLGIVKIDPIPYGLLFERFLNPDRISMPDIDIDIEDIYREEVINYMRIKYGKNNVARIATEGTAAAKAIIKDVCRVNGRFIDEIISNGFAKKDKDGNLVYLDKRSADALEVSLRVRLGNMITKTIPNTPNIKIKDALEESLEFKELYMQNPQVKELVDIAIKLEGLKKNLSVHACGVLVTDGPVVNYMPQALIKNADLSKRMGEPIKQWATQYQAPECEDLGCLKIDFLGLRTLGTISSTLKTINQNLANDFYTSKTMSSAMINFCKKGYTEMLDNLKIELELKLEAGLAKKVCVDEILDYLKEHETCKSLYDALTLQLLAGQINTPSCFINKNVSDLIHIRERDEALLFDDIPINETAVYEFISTAQTDGIFQIESSHMKNLMQELYQDVDTEAFNGNIGFQRLCDANALGRPGPMKEIPNYVKNMLNPSDIIYDSEKMKEFLDPTNGIIVYQEQMMFMCRALAGFTRGQADTVRKGCGKKIAHIIEEYGNYFVYGCEEKGIPGCIKQGIEERVALSIWDKMVDFGKYAFNKSHSVTYSVNSAITAWLSYYFPNEYMAAVLNSYLGSADKIKGYLGVCKRRGIEILHPNINASHEDFLAQSDGILFGLKGLRNLGASSDIIIKEREENGPFLSILDFAKRIKLKSFKSSYEALCYAGCFDAFEGSRKDKLAMTESLVNFTKEIASYDKNNQQTTLDFFDIEDDFLAVNSYCSGEEIPKQEKLSKEYEYAGFYITEHPLDEYSRFLKHKNLTQIGFLQNEDDEDEIVIPDTDDESLDTSVKVKSGQFVSVAGIIKNLEFKHKKSDGAKFAIFEIEDQSGVIRAIAFTKEYELYEKSIVEDRIAIFKGKYVKDDFGVQLQIKTVNDIVNANASINIRTLYLLGDENSDNARTQFKKIRKLAKDNPGDVRIFFKEEKIHTVGGINLDIELLNTIYEIMGGEHKVTVNHYRKS